MNKHLNKQQGLTLILALILLVLLTLIVITSVNMTKGSLQTVGNMQQRNEAYSAAQETIAEVISSTRFIDTPDDALPSPCNGVPNTKCVDTNADGKADVAIKLAKPPTCSKVQAVKTAKLDLAKEQDVGCVVGQQQNFGTAGAATGASLCSDSVWEIQAEATDVVTEAKVEITQGVAVRVSNDAVSTQCP
ncbi:PilX N-terminal domain-containing pilus assembly protein [Noviherbaspirillum aerium]|uniref:PilX N-terminal domain-containing pilus assembly protein n=1 Tax=Noviherbaspirillum aerium TaxID=2588497 RepID=UPI00124F63D6|nr:PilX N-terminal domain-containing pilus assembly protein [Noviherbaspirillum aerium]